MRVWEPGGRLRVGLRVSHRPVQRLALHPSLPQFSALVGEASRIDTLAAWDWERGQELFTLSSDRQLLHLAYAPQGGYLAYSRADYRSLAAVDAQSGTALGLLRTGFGIVSFFVISRNENTIMGYQPSGRITYWDLQEDRSVRQLRTLADLSLIRITPSNRHILAAAGERLVAVDLLSGALAAEDPAPGLARVGAGAGRRRAGGGHRGGPPAVAFRRFDAGPLRAAGAGGAGADRPGLRAGGAVRGGSGTAPSAWWARGGTRRVLARNLILPVGGLAFRGELAAAATPEGILLFRSAVLTGPWAHPKSSA